uniref:Uncharacterized protein n=1 Tax=Marseillevirus LCMAC101 TaxID=2506602 RepID=A0A481YTA3_9VIRU|nr:MAG: hypothetical protein LCMAC101_03210 [Marseillevirus LCMAC101]
MSQSLTRINLPPCDWLSAKKEDRTHPIYPNTANWFVNLATRTHDIVNFATGAVAVKCEGKEIKIGQMGKTYEFSISRAQDLIGNFALAVLLPPLKWKSDTSIKILKSVSLHYSGAILTLSGEENYQKAVEAGLWPWKTNRGDSSYFLIPLMFPKYISLNNVDAKISIQLEEADSRIGVFDGDIHMILTGFAVLLQNNLRIELSKSILNKPDGIFIDELTQMNSIKYQSPDKNEIIRFTNTPLKEEYTLPFTNDSKAVIVEISCDDPNIMNEVLPVRYLEVIWGSTLAVHVHAVNAREYYWKLCKILVPHNTSFLLPFSLDLVTPHVASVTLELLTDKFLHLDIHPTWKDVRASITITSIGHAVFRN